MPGLITPTGTYRPDLELVVMGFDPRQAGYIASVICPLVPATKKGGTYTKLDSAYLGQRPGISIKRPSRASAVRGEYKATQDTYLCERNTYAMQIDDDERDDHLTSGDAEEVAAMLCRKVILDELEADIVSLFNNTGTFPLSGDTGYQVAASWFSASGTPRADVHTMWTNHKVKTGRRKRDYWLHMTQAQAHAVGNTTDYLTRRHAGISPQGTPTEAELADYFEVGRVVIADASYNSAKMGLSASFTEHWDNNRVGLFVAPAGGKGLSSGPGRIVYWNRRGNGQDVRIDTYRDEDTTSDIVRAESYYDPILMDSSQYALIDVTP